MSRNVHNISFTNSSTYRDTPRFTPGSTSTSTGRPAPVAWATSRRGGTCGPASGETPGMSCIKIGLPRKLILGDYSQENRTSRRPFLLLRIRFPGRTIFIQFIQVLQLRALHQRQGGEARRGVRVGLLDRRYRQESPRLSGEGTERCVSVYRAGRPICRKVLLCFSMRVTRVCLGSR